MSSGESGQSFNNVLPVAKLAAEASPQVPSAVSSTWPKIFKAFSLDSLTRESMLVTASEYCRKGSRRLRVACTSASAVLRCALTTRVSDWFDAGVSRTN